MHLFIMKQNLHSFIVASFNVQSMKGNDLACIRCEISTLIIIIIIMVIFKCYFSGELIALS